MTEFNLDQLLAVLGAGGGGAYLAVKVALAQVLKSIEHAQGTGDKAHLRIDAHLQAHIRGDK